LTSYSKVLSIWNEDQIAVIGDCLNHFKYEL